MRVRDGAGGGDTQRKRDTVRGRESERESEREGERGRER